MLYTNRLLTSGFIQLFAILMLAGATHLEINAMNPGAHGGLMRTDDNAQMDRDAHNADTATISDIVDENATTHNRMGSGTKTLLQPSNKRKLYGTEDDARQNKVPKPSFSATPSQRTQQLHSSSSSSSSPSISAPAPATLAAAHPIAYSPSFTEPSSMYTKAYLVATAAVLKQQQQEKENATAENNADHDNDAAMIRNYDHKLDATEYTGKRCGYKGCDKSFARADYLQRHIKKHTGERPYTCNKSDCRKSFVDKHKLKRHMAIHTGIKSYKCTHQDCGKSFGRNDHLTEPYGNTYKRKNLSMQAIVLREEL